MDGLLVPRDGPPNIHLAVWEALLGGIVLVMVMQTLAIGVASFIWGRRMRGSAEQS
jgi:hypothetical protein